MSARLCHSAKKMQKDKSIGRKVKMTKQLLTALFIAGLSATAKAEPVVYYCNVIQWSDTTPEKISDLPIDTKFRMTIDLEKLTLEIKAKKGASSRLLDLTIANDLDKGQRVSPWLLDQSFTASSHANLLTFYDGMLTYTRTYFGMKGQPDPSINSRIASCDQFD